MDELKEYIQSTYGICNQSVTEGKCDCVREHKNQQLCPNWTKTTATNWEELLEIAKKQYGLDKPNLK
jgi:hypothetical protein